MLIVEPHCEYWPQTNMYEHIANIASVCYHSPKKEGEKAKNMVENLIKRNHISTTRHCSRYFIVSKESTPEGDYATFYFIWGNNKFDGNPYITVCPADLTKLDKFYVVTNYNYLLDNAGMYDILKHCEVSPEEFMKEAPELMRFTFCLTTQISTSREINRKSPNNIMEESSRYILYAEDGKAEPAICRPHWLKCENIFKANMQECIYLDSCASSFKSYNDLIEQGIKQEDARGVLPLDTKTTVIYTYSVKEWSDIFKLRYLDMTGKAHPNCKVIMGLVLKEFNKLRYRLTDEGDLVYDRKFNI